MNIARWSLLITMAVLTGCQQVPNEDRDLTKIAATDITAMSVEGRTLNITVDCEVPSPVYTFIRADGTMLGKDITFTLLAMPGEGKFPKADYLLAAPIRYTVPGPGMYYIHIPRKEGGTLDTTVIVR